MNPDLLALREAKHAADADAQAAFDALIKLTRELSAAGYTTVTSSVGDDGRAWSYYIHGDDGWAPSLQGATREVQHPEQGDRVHAAYDRWAKCARALTRARESLHAAVEEFIGA